MNLLSETLLFLPTRPTARYVWLQTRGRHAVDPHLARLRVAQSRCALYGLLIYPQGDRAGFFFGYGFYRNEVVLLAKPINPPIATSTNRKFPSSST